MSTVENMVLVRRVYKEAITRKKLDVLDEVVAPDLADHKPQPRQAPSREGFKEAGAAVHSAFPDYESVIEDEIAEGYEVVVRYKSRGTLRGIFPGVSPTGRQVSFTGIAIRRSRQQDRGTLEQSRHDGPDALLGVIPSPG
jgi:predicted ester cyclase